MMPTIQQSQNFRVRLQSRAGTTQLVLFREAVCVW